MTSPKGPEGCRAKIEYRELVDFVEGRLSEGERQRLESHLGKGCSFCSGEIALLNRMLGTLKQVPAPLPPPGLIERAKEEFRGRYGKKGLLKQLVAALSFDSRSNLAFGFRGAAQAGSYQLLFTFEDRELDLQVIPSGTKVEPVKFTLIGQLLPFSIQDSPATVILQNSKGEEWKAGLSETGELELRDLDLGTYSLAITLDEFELLVETIQLD